MRKSFIVFLTLSACVSVCFIVLGVGIGIYGCLFALGSKAAFDMR